MAIAPDGSWLASGGDDGSVRIWDPVTGEQRAALAGHAGPVTAVAIAPDGTWLASGGDDGSVRIWDPATGQLDTVRTEHIPPCVRGRLRPGRHAGWPAAATTGRCGSGTRSPASSAPPSPATPAR